MTSVNVHRAIRCSAQGSVARIVLVVRPVLDERSVFALAERLQSRTERMPEVNLVLLGGPRRWGRERSRHGSRQRNSDF